MLRPQIVFALPLVFAVACGGAQKKAEVPDFTEKGWSGPSDDGAVAKADPPIQSTPAKGDDATAMKADAPAQAPTKPETSGGAESDVVSGNALPPPPTKAAAKPNKAKKPGKSKKRKAQQS